MDELTDVSCCIQLLVFARYVKEKEVVEEFLFCSVLNSSSVDI